MLSACTHLAVVNNGCIGLQVLRRWVRVVKIQQRLGLQGTLSSVCGAGGGIKECARQQIRGKRKRGNFNATALTEYVYARFLWSKQTISPGEDKHVKKHQTTSTVFDTPHHLPRIPVPRTMYIGLFDGQQINRSATKRASCGNGMHDSWLFVHAAKGSATVPCR